uniref:Chromogranin-A n=1 Tax=Pipistrellus kuhlii TaxID=59472 RepID=A0A7J7SFM2_PIPKU|nr:chromogranin A [Pipistrellus kuhlii]
MRSAAVLALLLCAGQVMALPVNGPMTKFDDELMKCFVEVISDTLANPGPRPVSPKCSKTLRADERILSMLRHQNLLNELQDLAPQGATERARPEKKHSTLEEELSKFLERQKDQQNDQAELRGWSKDGAGEPGAEEAQAPEGQGDPESGPEEEMAGAPRGLLRGGKSREPEPEDERLSKEWEDAKRWSKMDQLAKELTADKRQEGEDEDDPDRSMRLSFRPRGYGFGGPGPQLRRGWRPSSQEDPEGGLAPQGRSYPEEKKEEEGSANRRPEDQELESLSAIEAELEKVSRQLQALQRG